MRIQTRELLECQPLELWDNLTGDIELVFDDGEILQTNAVQTLYSSYGWRYHQEFPNTPLLKHHHLTAILGKKRMSASTHTTLLGNCLWGVYDSYGDAVDRDYLAKVLYQSMNKMYNELSRLFERFVSTIDIVHFLEIMNDPEIRASKENLIATPRSIEEAYETIARVLNDPSKFTRNPIKKSHQSKLVNANQLNQCIGPIGYRTDTNSHQFAKPILRGYVEGLRNMTDNIMESRSASKALQFSKDNLRSAEYSSRKLQFADMQVKHLVHGDCGSEDYILWHVRGEQVNADGEVTHPSELPLLDGKRYLDEATGELKTIRPTDTHLIGTTIKMRSVLSCRINKEDSVCSTCFGELSLSVPKNTNLGHLCCVTMTADSTQSVLSVKHLDGNATIEAARISDADGTYLKVSRDKQAYLLHERLSKLKVKLIVPFADAPSLSDIMGSRSVEEFNQTRISEMEKLYIRVEDKDSVLIHSAEVVTGNRLSSFSYSFLNHVKRVGWEVDKEGHYVVDMTNWDYSEPVTVLPLRHFNMSDHSKEIADLLQSTKDQMSTRDKNVTPEAFLGEFFAIVNSKLSVNIAVLEVIVYGVMIISAELEDYRLPKPWTDRGISVHAATMANRSLGVTMAYQGHFGSFVSPESFVRKNRPDHVFDYLLSPSQCQEWEEKTGIPFDF